MSRTQNPIIESFDRYLEAHDDPEEPRKPQGTMSESRPSVDAGNTDDGTRPVRSPFEPRGTEPGRSGNGFTLEVYNSILDGDEYPPACFTPGTQILTPQGDRPIEDLEVGDKVVTRDNGALTVNWIGRKNLTRQDLERNPQHCPILIMEGSLGNHLPDRDTWVSPQHRVLFSSANAQLFFEEHEVLVAAHHLTELEGVERAECEQVTYIHLMFDEHELVLSNGFWSESFQPGLQTLCGMDKSQRTEILELFPELATEIGRSKFSSARRSLKKFETSVLLAQGVSPG
ncbi:Hint domain-containing protein [Shimia sp.]|uniref:Hint domain-containing protein n=1 Tax=Shimia sp. TaxID=1954381 RepID=UPI003BAACE62